MNQLFIHSSSNKQTHQNPPQKNPQPLPTKIIYLLPYSLPLKRWRPAACGSRPCIVYLALIAYYSRIASSLPYHIYHLQFTILFIHSFYSFILFIHSITRSFTHQQTKAQSKPVLHKQTFIPTPTTKNPPGSPPLSPSPLSPSLPLPLSPFSPPPSSPPLQNSNLT